MRSWTGGRQRPKMQKLSDELNGKTETQPVELTDSEHRFIFQERPHIRQMQPIKIIIEKHPDGYVAHPIGIKGIVIGEGDTYEDALADVNPPFNSTSRPLAFEASQGSDKRSMTESRVIIPLVSRQLCSVG
jgi:hypothetical protein